MSLRTSMCCLFAAVALAAPGPATAAPRIERVTGTPAFHEVTAVTMSRDGRYAALIAYPTAPVEVYGNYAPNFYAAPVVGPSLAQPLRQAFLVDRVTKKTTLLSAGAGGVPADRDVANPSISADGRYVTFQTTATNLLPRANPRMAGYLYDRVTRRLTRVSLDWRGTEIDDGSDVTITPDGATILLRTSGTVVRGDTTRGHGYGLFARDRRTGRVWTVTRGKTGSVGRAVTYGGVQASRTGRYVVVVSSAMFGGAYGPEADGTSNVYWFDTKTGSTRLVRGAVDDDTTCSQSLDDGNFCSYAVTAVAIDPNGTRIAYVVTTTGFGVAGSTRLLVVDVASGKATTVPTATSDVSGLVFSTDGAGLYFVAPPSGADSATGARVLYRAGLGTNATAAISPTPVLTSCRSEGCARLRLASVAPVANGVAFATDAPLTDDDTDGQADAYVATG